jgi:hypothetical protein
MNVVEHVKETVIPVQLLHLDIRSFQGVSLYNPQDAAENLNSRLICGPRELSLPKGTDLICVVSMQNLVQHFAVIDTGCATKRSVDVFPVWLCSN